MHRTRASRYRQFALGMKCLLASDRRKRNGMLPDRAENFRAQIGVADINHAPRAKLEALESFSVRGERHIVIHSGGQVPEVRWRKFLARGGFEVHNVQCVLQVGDRPAARRSLPTGNRARCEKRAPEQKSEEPAPVPLLFAKILCRSHPHGRPFYRNLNAGAFS